MRQSQQATYRWEIFSLAVTRSVIRTLRLATGSVLGVNGWMLLAWAKTVADSPIADLAPGQLGIAILNTLVGLVLICGALVVAFGAAAPSDVDADVRQPRSSRATADSGST